MRPGLHTARVAQTLRKALETLASQMDFEYLLPLWLPGPRRWLSADQHGDLKSACFLIDILLTVLGTNEPPPTHLWLMHVHPRHFHERMLLNLRYDLAFVPLPSRLAEAFAH